MPLLGYPTCLCQLQPQSPPQGQILPGMGLPTGASHLCSDSQYLSCRRSLLHHAVKHSIPQLQSHSLSMLTRVLLSPFSPCSTSGIRRALRTPSGLGSLSETLHFLRSCCSARHPTQRALSVEPSLHSCPPRSGQCNLRKLLLTGPAFPPRTTFSSPITSAS